MTNDELVAAWNVMQFQRKMGAVHRAESEVSAQLTERGITHEVGRRLIRVEEK